MDKNNWIKEVIKLINLAITVYLESSNKLRNIENYVKKSAKYLITLIIISIPVLLTIWGGLFLGLFFYITTKFDLSNYIAALIIAAINVVILIICLLWFKHKIRHNKLAKSNISILLTRLLRITKSMDNDQSE
ncbi:MAG TPA: hypothetical protein VKR58_08530 [Aquella sp.]|nr:hypothetical protein [Aquella sp.]